MQKSKSKKKSILLKSGSALSAMLVMSAFTVGSVPMSSNSADSYDMNISIDLSGERKEISPLIYGVNQYTCKDDLRNLNVNSLRQGGNRMTAYNWENNASNAGSDWKHSSDNNLSNSDEPADCVQEFSEIADTYNVGYKLTTLQMAGYASADKDGTVTEAEAAPSSRWVEVVASKNAPFDETPDLTDGKVYMDEYVNYIVNKLGDSTSPTGIQAYSLDNEPALWHHTHSRIHSTPVTIAELSEKSIELAAAVKNVDPNAEIFGPALYGYTAFDHLADDDTSDEWETIKAENNYHWYLDSYLDDMKKAEDEYGTRLLDVLDIHYYSESARNGAEDRLQSVRTLYEKGFAENSWIGEWCQVNVPILPTIQNSIDTYYPGTKLAISEYNFGGDDDTSGTIAQAEALGCYADAGVYFATLWGNGSYILSGINLYTNFDGKGGEFGDNLVPTKTEDVSLSSSYSAINGDDTGYVTAMITNKSMTETENAIISLNNSDTEYKAAAVYAVTQDSPEVRLIDIVEDITDNEVKVELPALSAAMVVITDNPDDLSGETIYDPNEFRYETVEITDFSDITNEEGFVVIPVDDPEHLVKISITGDVTSSAGSSWGTAGCALCMNAETLDGEGFWTYKSYSLSLGKGSTAEIVFDGYFTSDEEIIEGRIAENKVELQQWWESSEKQETEIEDIIEVNYTKVVLTYKYKGSETTEPAEILYGDANVDGRVTIADSTAILQHLGNKDKYALSEQGEINADCYNPGSGITGNDALAVQMLDAKLITKLPQVVDE